jgi:hypothetical protein
MSRALETNFTNLNEKTQEMNKNHISLCKVATQVVGFTVQGSRFTVGRFPLLIFLEIVDETTNDGTGSKPALVRLVA